jgi:hypothetical protein
MLRLPVWAGLAATTLASGAAAQDALVVPVGASKPIAQFRCTQMILWPKTG